MSDQFIREVDEEYRREQAAQIWRRYGGLILAVAFLVIAGVGGWRYYQHVELGRAEASAARFEAATRLSRDTKIDEAERAFKGIVDESPAGYRLLARFRLAAESGRQNAEEGAKAFDTLAADAGVEATMQDLARLRAAMLRLDGPDAEGAARALERLAVPTNPWRHTARELLGLGSLKRGDADAASRWFDAIAADREAPAGLRQRLEIYTALAAGGPVPVAQ